MRLVKVAVASVNSTVGAVVSNTDRALRLATEMAADGVTVAAFQEQLVSGYPPEDLVQWRSFVDAQRQQLDRFAVATSAFGTVFVLGLTVEYEAHRYNAAAIVHRGRILGVVPKEKLPTYNVFYEARTFTCGTAHMAATLWNGVAFGDFLFRFDWGVMATEICEDVWSPDGPMRRRAYSGAELVVNVSASPYRLGFQATRREMLATRSGDNQCALAYANAVGGQDGLIFDGGGFICQNGRVLVEPERFREGWQAVVLDLDRTRRLRAENSTWRSDALLYLGSQAQVPSVTATHPGADRTALRFPAPPGSSFFLPNPHAKPAVDARTAFCEEMLDALALGLGDYFEKNRFRMIGIALSGGRDSMLALLITWRWLQKRYGDKGAETVRAKAHELIRTFYMPTRYSSDNTRAASETISREVGVPFVLLTIEEAFEREMDAARAMLQKGEDLTPITIQNIQARIRAARMWNWANATGGLFLQTGNMSEKAMGYTTIGGDLEGGLSVISNVPKTVVNYLLDYLAVTTGFEGIKLCLAHPAGPELAPDQEGEKELMPFQVLDACFYLYASEKLANDEILAALESLFPQLPSGQLKIWVDRFLKMFTQSIYKWVQAPLALHVGNLDLDRERALQLPVVESSEWRG